jgi:hypothetical protein
MHVRRASHGIAPPLNCGVRRLVMPKRTLTFEVTPDGSEIVVHGDVDSIRSLAKRLETIASEAEAKGEGHLHLFSDDWMPNGDLTKHSPAGSAPDSGAVDHVKVYCWGAKSGRVPDA